jgi:hypothetical protein
VIYIFDIDGTLADISHRLHFIQQKPSDWRRFFAACVDDVPIKEVIQICNLLHAASYRIILVSGRGEEIRAETVAWLNDFEVHFGALYMREEDDYREDSILKGEILDEIRKHYPDEEIAGVFEDRKQVVDMYRAKGLRVFQVAEGDF